MKKTKPKSGDELVSASTHIPRKASVTIKKLAKVENRTYCGQLRHVLTCYADDNTLPDQRN